MDLITSFQSDPGPLGEKYILLVTDVFSGFCLLRCLTDKTAHSVASELWKIFADFGPPRQIQSDNGGEFGADLVQQVISQYHAQQRPTPSYNPRSAGKVERNVGTTSTTLRKLLHGTNLHWSKLVPAVQLAINCKHQNLTNSSPFALIFNRVANNYQSVTHHDITSIPPSSYNDWLTREQELHTMIFPVINTRISTLQTQYNRSFQPRSTSISKLPNGALVMLKDPLVPRNKNSQPWLGPYTIVRSSRLGLYTLRDFAGGIYHRDVPRDVLKLVKSSHIAASESLTYYVSEILDSRETNGSTEFLVKYEGYDEPSWEPAENIDDHDLIRKFRDRQRQVPLPSSSASASSSSHAPQRKARKQLRFVIPAAVSSSPVTLPATASSILSSSSSTRTRSPSSRLRDSVTH